MRSEKERDRVCANSFVPTIILYAVWDDDSNDTNNDDDNMDVGYENELNMMR